MAKPTKATFGEMLTEGIQVIKKRHRKDVTIIQDELGYALSPVRSGRSVERWRYGAIPPTIADVETLAREIIGRSDGYFGREWLHTFLTCANHPYPQKLCDELFPLSDEPASEDHRNRYAKTEDRRNQLILLDRVQRFWVENVLEKSLHSRVLLELDLQEKPDAIDCPWSLLLQTPDQPGRPLPSSAKLVAVFDQMNGALLILGEPGAGKTTLLLALARETIVRARYDPTQPIPVIFNLSSWTKKRQSLVDWLVDELNIKYQIPKRIGRIWIESNNLLLLLDGLDEVALTWQPECVEAINLFRQEYGFVNMVVCSRIAEYEALTSRLMLQGAILLQPPTRGQIDNYLAAAGSKLASLRAALEHDTTLQELARSPLMLSVMSLAYQNISSEALATQRFDAAKTRRQHLFTTYMEQMFKRRGAVQPYSPEQTIHWLTWLAQKMGQHSQSMFLIEQMQPIWLPKGRQQSLYTIASRLLGGLLGTLLGILWGGLFGGLNGTEVGGRHVFGLELALIGGSIGWLAGDRQGAKEDIHIVEVLQWSWATTKRRWRFTLLLGLLGMLLVGLFFLAPFGLGAGLSVTLIGGGVTALAALIMSGLVNAGIETKTYPNQGIWQSAKSALVLGVTLGLVSWLAFELFAGLLGLVVASRADLEIGQWMWETTRYFFIEALLFGFIMGVAGCLKYGGFAFIRHFILRTVLSFYHHTPWNYAHFLDYAAERILLQKVGGGYIFIHRLLLEHLATWEGKPQDNAMQPGQREQGRRTGAVRTLLHLPWERFVILLQLVAILFSVVIYGPDVTNRTVAAIYKYQGDDERASGNLEQATLDYSRAIESDPGYIWAYTARGRAYQAAGNLEAAIQDHNQAIHLEPDNAALYYNRARSYQLSGHLEAAIQDYNQAIALNPKHARAYYNRGGTHQLSNNLEKAIQDYGRAIELGLDNATVYHDRGYAYLLAGDLEKAIQDYNQVIALDPNYARAYYARGYLYATIGDLEKAIQDYSQAIELAPGNATFYYNRGNAYQRSDELEEAIQDYSQAIELGLDNATVRYSRGYVYDLLGNLEGAIQDYSKAIELDPNLAKAYYNRGYDYANTGNPQRAILDFELYLALVPDAIDRETIRSLIEQLKFDMR